MLFKRRRPDPEIAPDEIFLDSLNAPSFDRARFEGRLERPLGSSAFLFLAGALALMFLILVIQSLNLQLVQGTVYAAESEKNSLAKETLFAVRGVITDSKGVILAHNETAPDGAITRVYTTPGFGHLLGYISYPKKDSQGNYYDTSTTGIAGLEATFNTELAGQNGSLLVEKDALGQVKSQGSIVEPVNGSNLTLSIDARVQKAFY